MQEKTKSNDIVIAYSFTAIAFFALLIVRSSLFYYESYDFTVFLSDWVSKYREMSFIEGLGTRVGNYNQPYMYLLNIFARLDISELYLIKVLSVCFDVMLAYYVSRLVSLRTNSLNMQIAAFLLAFAIPTVILNGSMWGQCDVIFTAFAAGSVYYALCNKSKAAFAFIALAVSFKMQAAFILPIFAVFIFKEKIKLRDCWVSVVIFIGLLMPAFFAGFPPRDLFLMYFDQSNTYHRLNLNAINIWQFVTNVEFMPLRTAGLFAGGAAILSLMYFTYVNRKRLTGTADYIRLTFLSAVLVPYLLPQMHDRFFFMADAFALVVFLFDKRRWYVPLVCVFCSYLTYAWLIMEYVYVFDYKLAVLALTAVIFIVLRDYVKSLTEA